jgi:predicted transcriptional regulator
MNLFVDRQTYVKILRKISSGNGLNLSNDIRLNPSDRHRCLNLLVEKSLIKYDRNAQEYKLTQKGMHFLNAYDKVIELLSRWETKKEQIIV